MLIKRIELHPVKRVRQEAARLAKRVKRNLKGIFSKKRNQRKMIYIIGGIAILTLSAGLINSNVSAQKQTQQLNEQLNQTTHTVINNQEQLESVQEDLQTVKQQKVDTETQLQEKAKSEADLKAKLDEAQKQLEAKATEEQAQTVASVEESTGGRGGDTTASTPVRGVSTANTYDAGYCTWYVKERRPDLPNNLGNANTWYARAEAQGLAVGSLARAGAVGTTTAGAEGHVVYVESVNSDGTINISEMNHTGWNEYDSRTVDASLFLYIY